MLYTNKTEGEIKLFLGKRKYFYKRLFFFPDLGGGGKRKENKHLSVWLLKVWSRNKQQWHRLKEYWKCTGSGPTPEL